MQQTRNIKKINNDIFFFQNNDSKNNSYILLNEKNALVIDCSVGSFVDISEFIDLNKLNLVGVLLTHGHFDHLCEINNYINKYGINLFCFEKELNTVISGNLANFFNATISIEKNKIKTFNTSEFKIKNIELNITPVPGHTPGAIIIKYKNVYFVGDLIFSNSIGRYDLPGSNATDMFASLKKVARIFDDNDLLLSGHGDNLTWKEIKNNNVVLKKIVGE